MRLLIPCHTGSSPVQRSDIEASLTPLGWLPSEENQAFVVRKTSEILSQLPDEVRTELEDVDPILIEAQAGTWGLCSLEKRNTVTFRVIHPDAGELQLVARRVVEGFAPALESRLGSGVEFPESVQIRKIDNQESVGSGVIQRRPDISILEYVQLQRRRELRLMGALLTVFVLSAIASLAMFVLGADGRTEVYVRGWMDRLASAFLVALLSTILAMVFDYRSWRGRGDSIAWTFGEAHYLPD